MKNEKTPNTTKYICYMEIAIFLLLLIPLFAIAHYNFPSCDDFSFASDVKQVILQNGSVWDALKQACLSTAKVYQNWQGTYTATFFASISIGALYENLYFIGTYWILLVFIFAELFFMKTIFVDIMNTDKYTFVVVSLPILMMQILFVPYPVEAFYWYDGSMAYTFFYSLFLFMFSVIIKLYQDSQSKGKRIIYVIIAVFLSLLIGGGNFVSAFLMVIICSLAILIFIFYKKRKSEIFIIWFSAMSFFFINIMAPGNRIRQSANINTSVIKSILKSLYEAYRYTVVWTNLAVVLLMLLLIPFLWRVISHSKYRFRYPLLFLLVTFGIFAAHLTPVIYAQSYLGPGRLTNLIYYSYYFFLFANFIYFLGWLRRILEDAWEEKGVSLSELLNALKQKYRNYLLTLSIIELILFVSVLSIFGLKNTSSFSAYYSLKNKEASIYKEEYQERLSILYDDSIRNAELKAFSVKPHVLYFDDLTEDSNDWRNIATAQYYGKDSIIVK